MIKTQHNRISWWKATGSLILAMSMLVHSGFSAVTTMECFMSGTQRITLSSEDSCCKTDAAPIATLNVKCCDVNKAELTFHSYKVEHTDFVLLPLASFALSFERYVIPALKAQKFLKAQFTNGPPLSGRAILIQICKYTL